MNGPWALSGQGGPHQFPPPLSERVEMDHKVLASGLRSAKQNELDLALVSLSADEAEGVRSWLPGRDAR
jgi:hypothetical protein